MRTIDEVKARLRAEYMEMPGLWLTAAQVQRLCGIEAMVCALVLTSLVDARFLCMKPDGQYGRITEGAMSRPQPAKAHLRLDQRNARAS
jgi:hypothetical protein